MLRLRAMEAACCWAIEVRSELTEYPDNPLLARALFVSETNSPADASARAEVTGPTDSANDATRHALSRIGTRMNVDGSGRRRSTRRSSGSRSVGPIRVGRLTPRSVHAGVDKGEP